MEFKRNKILLGENVAKIYVINKYPPSLGQGWASKITNLPNVLSCQMFEPCDNSALLESLSGSIRKYNAEADNTKDPLTRQRAERASEDASNLMRRIEENGEVIELPPPEISHINNHTIQNNNTQMQILQRITEPWAYADGSIGTLSIPRFNVSVKVYHGESLANLDRGLGQFAFTSSWDGNIGLAGHNDMAFRHLKNLNVGDEIVYTTRYGTRTYVMSNRTIIDETDFSTLRDTSDNRLTLITCVEGRQWERYSVIAVEKK